MNIALWIIAVILGLAFIAAGAMKATSTKAVLVEKGMGWAEGFSDGQVKAIGVIEVLGGIGLIVPAFVDGLEWLVPTAAAGLVITMVGAVVVHVRRKEPFAPALVLGLLAAFVMVGRFWIETF